MNEVKYAQPGIITGALASNPAKVLRNTYLLLSMTLLFSAVTASVAMALGLPRGGALLLTLVSFGLLFWVRRTEDSSMGIVAVFAFTGCMGAALGPMLSFYLAMQQGPTIVMQALGGTALVFLTLSGYAMASRKDFSFLGGFLMTGMVVVLVGALANIFLQIPVFFALYKVILTSIELRHAPFFGWIKDLSSADPTNMFNLFGLLPFDPTLIPAVGPYLHIGVWPLIMGVSMFLQMKMNPEPTDPIQKSMFAWMPVIFTFMLGSFPAGLVIYWTWNNLLSVAQQYYIMKKQGVKVELWDNLSGLFGKKPV